MKTKINDLIVVEGKTDIDFLSSFLDANFYSVNGSAVNEKDAQYLSKVSEKTGIIILTDPDFPGEKIRNYLNENIANVKNAYVRKEYSIKKNKVGVAESTKSEVLRALENYVIYNKENKDHNLSNYDLYELGLIGNENSKELRKIVDETYHTGKSNGKSLLKKLNCLNVRKEELEKLLNA